MDDYCKRSGQIPAFGNWDYSNELPITQYFECPRQAGLIRYSSSSGESDPPYIRRSGGGGGGGDLYAVDGLKKGYRNAAHPRKLQTRVREKRGANAKDQNKKHHVVKKVCDVTEPPRKPPPNFNNNKLKHHNVVAVSVAPTRPPLPVRPPKAVDEDLYKIPPELLHSSKRKKMPGFFSCLVPACAS